MPLSGHRLAAGISPTGRSPTAGSVKNPLRLRFPGQPRHALTSRAGCSSITRCPAEGTTCGSIPRVSRTAGTRARTGSDTSGSPTRTDRSTSRAPIRALPESVLVRTCLAPVPLQSSTPRNPLCAAQSRLTGKVCDDDPGTRAQRGRQRETRGGAEVLARKEHDRATALSGHDHVCGNAPHREHPAGVRNVPLVEPIAAPASDLLLSRPGPVDQLHQPSPASRCASK